MYRNFNKILNLLKKNIHICIIILILFVIYFLRIDIYYRIKNMPLIACWDKPICIYSINYNSPYPTNHFLDVIDLKNKQFLLKSNYYKKYHLFRRFLHNGKYVWKRRIILHEDPTIYDFIKYDKEYNKPSTSFDTIDETFLEKYNAKINKFSKYKLPYKLENKTILLNEQGELILMPQFIEDFFYKNEDKTLEIYNIKTKEGYYKKAYFDKTNISYYLLGRYKNGFLVMSNNSDPFYIKTIEPKSFPKKNQKENLYFFDLSTLKMTPFISFALEPKYFPILNKELKNGKLIFSIFEHLEDTQRKENYNWDHIEIYDPETNKFYINKTPMALSNNILSIEYDNSDVLFINKNGSYIFKNKSNNFVDVTNKNKDFIEKIKQMAIYHLGKDIMDLKSIKLTEGEFILLYPYSDTGIIQDDGPKRTIYIDYNKKLVIPGPIFPGRSNFYKTFPLKNNKYLLFWGNVNYGYEDYPSNVYIIKTKK